MTTRQRLQVQWLADGDREAHATVRGKTRTLCGRLPAEERFAWPAETRCGECRAKVADLERERVS